MLPGSDAAVYSGAEQGVMMIENFPYTLPLAGGLMIGLASVILLLSLGRIAGISGIVWGAISAQPDNAWRWTFIVGLLAGPLLFHTLSGTPYPQASQLEWWHAVAGGLLVGFGTKLGSGCTSGHGATITFMVTGIATVYVIRHVLGGL
jgi:hypothetical protein